MDLKHLLNQTTIGKSQEPEPEPESPTMTTAQDFENCLEPEPSDEESAQTDSQPGERHLVKSLDSRFALPWNKLEKGSKMNRLLLFITREVEERSLTESQGAELKKLLFKACESGCLNKTTDVKYDSETGIIESIKHLEFNESSKKYKLKTGGTKSRSVSKSRSNIDRLMKKKN